VWNTLEFLFFFYSFILYYSSFHIHFSKCCWLSRQEKINSKCPNMHYNVIFFPLLSMKIILIKNWSYLINKERKKIKLRVELLNEKILHKNFVSFYKLKLLYLIFFFLVWRRRQLLSLKEFNACSLQVEAVLCVILNTHKHVCEWQLIYTQQNISRGNLVKQTMIKTFQNCLIISFTIL